jgi:hypothetical protein
MFTVNELDTLQRLGIYMGLALFSVIQWLHLECIMNVQHSSLPTELTPFRLQLIRIRT